MMLPGAASYLVKLFIYAQLVTVASGYSDKACCNRAREDNAFVSPNNGSVTPMDDIICGQVYNESSPAAPDAYVTYNFCKSECGGWGVSSVENGDQWAGPIVQFILPSVIFSMNIPRRFEFVSSQWLDLLVLSNLRGWKRAALSLILTFPALLFVAADTIIWVMTIMCMAGPMMVASLHEALLDFKILKALKTRHYIPDSPRASEGIPLDPMGNRVVGNNVAGGEDFDGLRDKVELLVTVLAGNLLPETYESWPDNLIVLISDALMDTGRRRLNNEANPSMSEQLKRLMTAQSAFGAIVGAAVVFYLGAFVYTILDLLGDKSNQDAAISLAFGVEWMIIVHVAIVNGFLLASNNPSPVTMLIGRPRSTLFSITVLLALFTSIATTLMQIIGVFRNCFCYVNSGMWLDLNNAVVKVASDTKDRRNSSDGWIVMGGVATIFMAVCSFFGWWFQMNIRVSFEDAIKDIDDLF
ncbi:glycoside hydrolase family 3 [Fusarium mundagurra]|uniref:Glycoside hydrolase family 3 n=1 Tax=Fusarium mundagurra TaxID=1567541 RepID=A0A8H5Y8Y6_9HYPO|nr:glycoside hydrolase family 3 [Fusarium mundagurra]